MTKRTRAKTTRKRIRTRGRHGHKDDASDKSLSRFGRAAAASGGGGGGGVEHRLVVAVLNEFCGACGGEKRKCSVVCRPRHEYGQGRRSAVASAYHPPMVCCPRKPKGGVRHPKARTKIVCGGLAGLFLHLHEVDLILAASQECSRVVELCRPQLAHILHAKHIDVKVDSSLDIVDEDSAVLQLPVGDAGDGCPDTAKSADTMRCPPPQRGSRSSSSGESDSKANNREGLGTLGG